MNHRREFIKTAAAAVLALGVAPGTLAAKPRPRPVAGRKRPVPLSHLHYPDFAEQLNTPFLVSTDSGGELVVLLAEAQDLSDRFGAENFSITFHGPTDQCLRQGTYRFEHRWLGAFSLFIVPLRGNAQHASYEAVFNRVA